MLKDGLVIIHIKMICSHCAKKGKIVEMILYTQYLSHTDYTGQEVEMNLGSFWICPECDEEENYLKEDEKNYIITNEEEEENY